MRQLITTLLNILVAIIAVITLSIVQIEFSNSETQEIVNSSSFTFTDAYKNILNERMDEVFTLISLKNVFESNDEVNYSSLVAESLDKVNGIKKWTLNDCLNEAKAHGLVIDNDNNVIVSTNTSSIPFSKSVIYNFMLKLYPSSVRTGAQSEEVFLTEFMNVFADYCKANEHLNSKKTNFKYIAHFYDELNERELVYKNTSLSEKEILEANTFIYISSKDNRVSSNLNYINSQALNLANQNNPHPDMDFSVYYTLDPNYEVDDAFKEAYNKYTETKNRCSTLNTIAILSGIMFLLSLILNLTLIFQTKKNIEESKNLFVQIPTELYVLLYIFEVAILLIISQKVITSGPIGGYDFSKASAGFCILSVYIPTMILILLFTEKYSNDTLTPTSIKTIKENIDETNNTITPKTLFWGTLVPITAFVLISIYLIYRFTMTNDTNLLVIAFFIFISTLSFSIYILYLYNAFNEAISVETRSNEMRTTLITNVTHDIKTPLTSILNYAEIITDEIKTPHEDSKENLLEYSKALINKSNRLNELINDLIYDSKVSSGNIELDMQKIDLNAFLNQCIAEFGDKLDEKGLKVLYESTAKNTFIHADSNHLYRVFQNLFSNIYKYALENSRVYIDLKSRKSKLITTIKNIQKEKLEVDVDTLKNRFVRGSKSRSTEGFGLGLSITDNLIKSMKGTFEIKSVKDQFTAIITFLIYDEQ